MLREMKNPYPAGLEHDIWEMCVRRDLEAFASQDWGHVAADYSEDFLGIDACSSNDPTDWIPKYPTLNSYQLEFESQAKEFAKLQCLHDPILSLNSCLSLSDIQINEDRMLVTKVFDGDVALVNTSAFSLKWKSLFHLRHDLGTWRFTGFVGYLPL